MVTRYDYIGGSYPMGVRDNGEYVDYDDYAALEARVAELERDEARYRWLRNQNNREVGARILTNRMNVCAAIDKAMEE